MLPLANGITQICYVVRDLDEAMDKWVKAFRAGPFFVAEFKNDGHEYRGQTVTSNVRVGIGYSSSLNIELLQPLSPGPSIHHEILETRGEGVHHFWCRSSDLDAEIAHWESLGCPVVGGGPTPGIGRSYFVDTLSMFGVFTEIQELSDAVYLALDKMHQTHLNWDGKTDPVRPFPPL